jgi:23S rRNA pseudouridine2605 synthase
MARVNKSGKSSFGKRTDAENSFRKSKGKGGARDEGDKKRSGRSPGGAASTFRPKPDGDRTKPYRKREDSPSSSSSERPRFSRSEGTGRSFGDGESKRPYKKREDSAPSDRPRFSKSSGPSRSYGDRDNKKPYGKRDDSSSERPKRFSKPEGETKRPYKRRDEDSSSDRPQRFSKASGSVRSYGDRDKKRPEKRESPSFQRPRGDDKKEKKSFVQNRIDNQNNAPVRSDVKEKKEDDGLIRLNKFISNSGVCSRREADELIKMGLISVNGTTITEMGYKVKPTDDVRHEDKKLKAEKPVYVLLNKPKGFITTTEDPQERNTVMGLVASACKERIYPVGRLDRNTTGLLLLTNDGDLTDKLTHPSYNIKKIYKAELDKPLTKNDFQKIADGVHLEEGKAIVDDIAIVSEDGLTIGLELHIGWNRIVRRIFESLGYNVVKLDRVVYAGLDKKDLKRGQWRFLKSDEIVRLKHFK